MTYPDPRSHGLLWLVVMLAFNAGLSVALVVAIVIVAVTR